MLTLSHLFLFVSALGTIEMRIYRMVSYLRVWTLTPPWCSCFWFALLQMTPLNCLKQVGLACRSLLDDEPDGIEG